MSKRTFTKAQAEMVKHWENATGLNQKWLSDWTQECNDIMDHAEDIDREVTP